MPFNMTRLRRAHNSILIRSDKAIAEELDASSKFAQKHVRENPRGYKHRTGKLIQATKGRVVRVGGKTRVVFSNSRKYAAALDEGARPHLIRPRKAKYLRFMSGGHMVFAKVVKHPGMKATHFLYRASMASARVAHTNIEARLTRIAARRY